MKAKFYLSIFGALLFLLPSLTMAQGCVAVRNMSSCSLGLDSLSSGKSLQISLNYRYFRSYKHFRGDHEEVERVENGTEVINDDNSVILGLNYSFNSKFSVAVSLPYLFINRSSLYEHWGNSPGNPRFHTSSKGLGDVRIVGYYNVKSTHRSRLTFGAGLKLPTGKKDYNDYFHKRAKNGTDSLIYKVVDQSIQPGDGGLGVILEGNYSKAIGSRFQYFADGMYMLNPKNTNGVLRSTSPSSVPRGNEFSVSDQFMARTGMRYAVKAFQFGLGGRVEGIPARDLIGENDGFRRPGHIVSAEASASFAKGPHIVAVNFPYALYRNRIRSVLDVQRTVAEGNRQHGDAAFANWLISITYAYRISL
jgi:hypothetical protein